VDAVAPSVAEGLNLLWLARDVLDISVFDLTAGGGPLEIRIKLDSVRWIDIDALHLAAQFFALRERCHNLQAVAQDQAITPVGIVLIELSFGSLAGQAIEISEQIELTPCAFRIRLRTPQQVVNEHFRLDFFLDVQGWCMDNEIRPVLLVLAAPN
jgi:hypothetical protein